jgi:hypothetical protein
MPPPYPARKPDPPKKSPAIPRLAFFPICFPVTHANGIVALLWGIYGGLLSQSGFSLCLLEAPPIRMATKDSRIKTYRILAGVRAFHKAI